jgi:hypothetical protein
LCGSNFVLGFFSTIDQKYVNTLHLSINYRFPKIKNFARLNYAIHVIYLSIQNLSQFWPMLVFEPYSYPSLIRFLTLWLVVTTLIFLNSMTKIKIWWGNWAKKNVLRFKYTPTSLGICKRMSSKIFKCVHTLGVGIMLYAKSLEQGLGDQNSTQIEPLLNSWKSLQK